MNLLFPLNLFYEQLGLSLPAIEQVSGAEVPEPYRRLLVHDDDMTPTLEAFYGERVDLKVLGRRVNDETLSREVLLTQNSNGRAVEFGAILIHLAHYPPDAREAIMAGGLPLGTILAKFRVAHLSCPQAFVRVQSDPTINEALGLPEGTHTLYGRRNIHATVDKRVLADILEILPPHTE